MKANAQLAAAPDLVRALLAVEWRLDIRGEPIECVACRGTYPRHTEACVVDRALRKAGAR